MFTTKIIKSHVKLEVKSNATKIPRESTPYITLFSSSSTIENFSACCNTLRGIKLAAPQADRLRSACSLAKTSVKTPTSPNKIKRRATIMIPITALRNDDNCAGGDPGFFQRGDCNFENSRQTFQSQGNWEGGRMGMG